MSIYAKSNYESIVSRNNLNNLWVFNPGDVCVTQEMEATIDSGEKLAVNTEKNVKMTGVVVAMRRMGKVAFGKILGTFGQSQFILRQNEFGDEYKQVVSDVILGTHIAVYGQLACTATKEPSVLCVALETLQDARKPFPDKWNGVSEEEKRNLRYQDCLVNLDKHNLFVARSKFVSSIRRFFENCDFIEVETPIMHRVSAGAQARPFVTECNALGDNMYLRIAPETYLKRMTAGGFHKVFEIGKQFRNEGIDSSHMPEFTSLEYYEAYTNAYQQITKFISLLGYLKYQSGFKHDDLKEEPLIVTYEDLYNKYVPNLLLEETPENEIDQNFKKFVRPNITKPVFVIDYPAYLAPLAKRKVENPKFVEMWQFIWNGQEVVKCYSELVDPVEQRKLLEDQMAARENGDAEAMMLDESFLQTMEFGMPPQAGVGIGIDRLFALYMGVEDIRDTVFFPPGF